jgi:hypothetical protein
MTSRVIHKNPMLKTSSTSNETSAVSLALSKTWDLTSPFAAGGMEGVAIELLDAWFRKNPFE